MQEEKYVQELSRIKAQNVVLKKAILDSQQKLESLQSSSRELQAKVRALEQEIDQYKYHNQRLTKRIEAMQHQQDQTATKNWSILGGTSIKKELELELQVLRQELEAKISDNERLNKKLSTIEQDHAQYIDSLNARNNVSERKIQELREELARTLIKSEDQLMGVQRQNAELEQRNKALESQVKNASPIKENSSELGIIKDYQIQISSLQELLTTKEEEIKDLREMVLEWENREMETKAVETANLINFTSQEQQTETKGCIDRSVETDPITINTSLNTIILSLNDYLHPINDEQMSREQLLKKYYEDKFSRMKNEI